MSAAKDLVWIGREILSAAKDDMIEVDWYSCQNCRVALSYVKE